MDIIRHDITAFYRPKRKTMARIAKGLQRFVLVKSMIRKDSRIEAFENDYRYRDRFFKAYLKKAKVRYRGQNHARHTYISQLLTAGVPKEWIAGQAGHTSTKMIDEHYGKWISEETPKMAEFVSGLLGFTDDLAPPQPQKKSGHYI